MINNGEWISTGIGDIAWYVGHLPVTIYNSDTVTVVEDPFTFLPIDSHVYIKPLDCGGSVARCI